MKRTIKILLYSIGFAFGLILALTWASKSEVFAMIFLFAIILTISFGTLKELL